MDKATIAIDVRMLGASGIGTYIENLLIEFHRMKNDFRFVLIGDTEKLKSKLGHSDSFKFRALKSRIFSISEQIRLPGLAMGADLLHSPHHNVPLLWSGKLIVTFHDALHWDMPELICDWRGKLYLKAVSRKIRHADAVIVPSQWTAQRLACNICVPQEKIFVIYQGVDKHHFVRRSTNGVRTVLSRYGLNPGGYLLYVGNMKPHKNIERTIKAYSIARKRGVNIPFVLAGRIEGLMRTISIESALSNEGVKYIGEVQYSELPYLYSGARAFLFVSMYEGFGLPPLEAMSCGCPVLTSTATSLPEVVGESAIKVNPNDVGKIADEIVKISLDLDLRKTLIEKGLTHSKNFGWAKTARETLDVYEKILRR